MAKLLPTSGLIELKEAEHLGVTDHGKSQSQYDPGCEKQSVKHSRTYGKTRSFAGIRLFDR
jgi:hypothetical protein